MTKGPIKVSDNPTSEEIEEFFKNDTFAYGRVGCRITEAWRGHGVAELDLEDHHCNAEHNVMGGVIFTLADYAFAAATMCGEASSTTLTSTIEFMRATKSGKLTATCDLDRAGRKVGFYTTDVHDDKGNLVARVVATCYRPIEADRD